MSFKKCKVVMLPTNEKSKLVLSFKEKSFNQLVEPKLTLIEESNYQLSNIQSQHLYILSDEEIKEGDWYINTWEDGQPMLCKVNSKEEANDCNRLNHCCKKIIATTDKSLVHLNCCVSKEGLIKANEGCRERNRCSLPQPSQSFIEKFVEEYNKGNVITEVMVEYETITKRYGSCSIGEGVTMNVEQLKVSKDNTITIRKVKDSWSREEVIALITKFNWDADATNDIWKDKWIEENL